MCILPPLSPNATHAHTHTHARMHARAHTHTHTPTHTHPHTHTHVHTHTHTHRCFGRFFQMVNINERRLVAWRRGFITENIDLVGLEYLWKVVLVAPDNIVYKPIELLKDVYTNLSAKLQQDQVHCMYETCPLRLGGVVTSKYSDVISSFFFHFVSLLLAVLLLHPSFVLPSPHLILSLSPLGTPRVYPGVHASTTGDLRRTAAVQARGDRTGAA